MRGLCWWGVDGGGRGADPTHETKALSVVYLAVAVERTPRLRRNHSERDALSSARGPDPTPSGFALSALPARKEGSTERNRWGLLDVVG